MSALTNDQIVYLTEILGTLLGIAITWLVYRKSERSELPGEAQIPDPMQPGEAMVDASGRTL
jgi:hypothetical protein